MSAAASLLVVGCQDVETPTSPSPRIGSAPSVTVVTDVQTYRENTTKIVITPPVGCTFVPPWPLVSSVADASLTVNFQVQRWDPGYPFDPQTLQVRQIPDCYNPLLSKPSSESTTPTVLNTGYDGTAVTLNLSQPVSVFGFEVVVNSCQHPVAVTARFYAGANEVGSVQRTLQSQCVGGLGDVDLFAWADAGITSAVVSVQEPQTFDGGFSLAQIRYSFTSLPNGAREQIRALINSVSQLPVHKSVKNSLTASLNDALAAVEANNTAAACSAIADFIRKVTSQSGKKISTSDAAALIQQATAISGELGCSG
jgi:hypothetical protein